MRRCCALIAVLSMLVTSCSTSVDGEVETSAAAATTAPPVTTASPSTTVAPEPTAVAAGIERLGFVAQPPWRDAELSIGVVPDALGEQWQAAENAATCSALFPADAATVAAGAEIRPARFEGGWGIAWDVGAGPGRGEDGEYCAECGRGAFGIAGTGGRAAGDEDAQWPIRLTFNDGSRAGYGYEGGAGASSGAPLLMYLLVRDEGCLYHVWSFRGEAHLLALSSQLRFVAELRGSPTPWSSEIPPSDVKAMGDPPWGELPLDPDDLDEIYHLEWAGEANAPASCPLLAFADLGEQASDARMRRALNEGEMLVAWDRPNGPGHDGASDPCADCGRGAIGLGTSQTSFRIDNPVTHEWSDGSRAHVFNGNYGTEARLQVEGFSCTYWVWSHLGPEHLEYLFGQLRRVEGLP